MLAGIGRIFHRSAAEGLAAMESYTRSVGGNFCLSKSPTQTKDGISMRQTQDPLSISGNHWLVREPNGSCLREPSQVLDAVLAVRGIGEGEQRKAFLNPSLVQMQHPREFSNAVFASKEILAALHAKKSIVVFGDYDVDGIMATAIMWHMLRAIDPNANVRTYVPHRIEEGYGLKIEALTKLREEGADLVITVDCGVSAVEAAAHAAKVGLQLVITDHHPVRADGKLPEALAIVHPEVKNSCEASAILSGAGVAWKVAWMLAVEHCGSDRVSEKLRIVLQQLLPLAALGTIADVVPLLGENRLVTFAGLDRIRESGVVGLDALLALPDLKGAIDSEVVGYRIGPRLNACGRLGHAEDAIELMTTADSTRAKEIVALLEKLNKERKQVDRAVFESVLAKCGETTEDCVIVLADDSWHPGVVGIVCNKVVDKFGKPCILLGGDGALLKGSGRSVKGFPLHAALDAAAAHLATHGGHAMAVGLSCVRENVKAVREAMNAYAREHLGDAPSVSTLEPSVSTLEIDCECAIEALDEHLVKELSQLAPFGRDNARPCVVVRNVELSGPPTFLGKDQKNLALQLKCGTTFMRAIWWRSGEHFKKLKLGMRVDIVLSLKLNTFGKRTSVEPEVHDLRIHDSA